MKNIVIAAVSALLFSCPVLAQQTLLGKDSGSFSNPDSRRGNVVTGISLEILSVDGDVVSAKAVRASPRGRSSCAGEYQLMGKVRGDILVLKSIEKAGSAGDCGLNVRLTVDGDKLVGTINRFDAQLSK